MRITVLQCREVQKDKINVPDSLSQPQVLSYFIWTDDPVKGKNIPIEAVRQKVTAQIKEYQRQITHIQRIQSIVQTTSSVITRD